MAGDEDKTEQPTAFRLEEARKRGEIAKSPDVTGSVVLVAFGCVIALAGTGIAVEIARATRRMIALAGQHPSVNGQLATWVSHAYAQVWQALSPLVLALLIAAVLGNMLQTGPMFTTHPIKPDFKRMNPMHALRRIFSLRSLWELGKLVAKIGLLSGIGALFAYKGRALAESAAMIAPQRMGHMLLATFTRTSIYVLAALTLVALADLLFVRREFTRKMRMSRREVRDEVKRRDGDPTIKSKQKQQLRELLKKTRALGRVHEADMVVTNPTHVAVALRYRPGETLAPVIVAKGAGVLSQRIRALANRHRVPVLRVPALARALYGECEIDGMVPEGLYAQLAPVYRGLWATKAGGGR